MLQFNHFKPDLITEFVPEESTHSELSLSNPFPLHDFLFKTEQIQDYIAALRYAEAEIIPALMAARSNQFADLSAEQIVAWIKGIHQRIANALIRDTEKNDSHSGEYSSVSVTRWHHTHTMLKDLVHEHLRSQNVAQAYTRAYIKVLSRYGLSDLTSDFVNILNKIDTDHSIIQTEYRRKGTLAALVKMCQANPAKKEHIKDFWTRLCKLIDAVHQGKLSTEEMQLVRQVVTICDLPENIPARMQQFAEQLLEKMRSCHGDIESVVDLSSFAYYNVTDIHAFLNGNGRTATVWMNIMHIIFNQPAILFRTEAEKRDPNSTYNRLIKNIDTDPSLLKAHIRHRLLAPQDPVAVANTNDKAQMLQGNFELYADMKGMVESGKSKQLTEAMLHLKLKGQISLPEATLDAEIHLIAQAIQANLIVSPFGPAPSTSRQTRSETGSKTKRKAMVN